MPIAPYGELDRQALIAAELGAAHGSKPWPV